MANDWVDFKEIKDTVSLKMVLDHYGVKLRPSGKNTLRGKCPLPTHSSKDSRESFIATLDKGTGGAWSCHSRSCAAGRGGKLGGNALDLVAALENCSVRDAAIKLQTWFLVPAAGKPRDAEPRKQPRAERSAGKEPENKLASEKNEGGGAGEGEPNKPLTFELQKIDHAHPYLVERAITEETARAFGVGFFPGKGSMAGKVVIEIRNEKGELVAYAGRTISDSSEPKYKFPVGFKKSLEVFNLNRTIGEPSAVLVEGFFGCMNVAQAGFPCIALMGSSMSQAQEDLIARHLGHVVVMLDGDEAGRSASEGIADRLGRHVFRVDVVTLPDGVQPDGLTKEEIAGVLQGVI